MNFYNGYSPKQRSGILDEYHRRQRSGCFQVEGQCCSVCDDPDCPPNSWHSEDYSEPFVLAPPASFVICKTCHGRIHKRFNQPDEWRVFLKHLNSGGYGREFTGKFSLSQRRAWIEAAKSGIDVSIPHQRPRKLTGVEWWQTLTLDPESLKAAWARPRPLRPRPGTADYKRALSEVRPTDKEMRILRFHAAQAKRSVCMRLIAERVLSSVQPTSANLAYGQLAHRLSDALAFEPDYREDGTPIWMSAVAEGWQPDDGEFEWVMVLSLASALP